MFAPAKKQGFHQWHKGWMSVLVACMALSKITQCKGVLNFSSQAIPALEPMCTKI